MSDTDIPNDPWEQVDRLQRVVNEFSDRVVREREKRLDAEGKLIRLVDENDSLWREVRDLRQQLLELKGPHG